MIFLIAYALVSAAVLGWLLHQHLTARNRLEDVPIHIFVLMPILWLPVAMCVLVLLLFAIVALWWRGKGYWA